MKLFLKQKIQLCAVFGMTARNFHRNKNLVIESFDFFAQFFLKTTVPGTLQPVLGIFSPLLSRNE